jgi:hypothetical protein
MNAHALKGVALVAALSLSIGLAAPAETLAAAAKNLVCRGCVNTRDIGKKAITSKHIKDNAIQPANLAPAAKPGGADFSAPVTRDPMPLGDVVVTSVTLDLPGPGIVIANSSGFARFDDNPSSVICEVTKSNAVGTAFITAENHNLSNARRMPISYTQGFVETAAGPQTYNMVCRVNVGNLAVQNVILTAVFVPNRY